MENADDESTLISKINISAYKELKEKKLIHSGMIPKLENAFTALESGVKNVIIGKAEDLSQLISGSSGTSIRNEQ